MPIVEISNPPGELNAQLISSKLRDSQFSIVGKFVALIDETGFEYQHRGHAVQLENITDSETGALSKVPAITLTFWLIKILATTVGETGGDTFSMTLNLGYFESSLIFLSFFVVALIAQLLSKQCRPVFYWAVVVATTTVGTTTSDFLDRTVGLGYVKSSGMLLCVVFAVLVAWHYSTGSIAAGHITSRKNEMFYWVTILFSNTLGTALGDFVATTTGLGFERGALVFSGLIACVAAAHYFTKLPDALLFWAAYVLTRPLGATLGDTLTKSHPEGGLALGRITSSLTIGAAMIILIALTSRHRERVQSA